MMEFLELVFRPVPVQYVVCLLYLADENVPVRQNHNIFWVNIWKQGCIFEFRCKVFFTLQSNNRKATTCFLADWRGDFRNEPFTAAKFSGACSCLSNHGVISAAPCIALGLRAQFNQNFAKVHYQFNLKLTDNPVGSYILKASEV